jgi:hypothetical protein
MKQVIYILSAIILFSCFLSAQNDKQSIKKKDFIPWSVTEKDGKHYCPLCGDEYIPKDFSKLPPKLSLSEWHPNNLDMEYFEKKIANISDMELYNSFDFSKVPAWSVQGGREEEYKRAAEMLIHKKKNEDDNNRLFGYALFDDNPMITIDEYLHLLNDNKEKKDSLLRAADDLLDLKIQYGPIEVNLKGPNGFNYELGGSRQYGFHYLGWLTNLHCAYLLTKDEKYVKAFDEIFRLWYSNRNNIKNTLPQYDAVWYELGIAARIPTLIDAFRVFKNHPLLSTEAKDGLIRTLLSHGRWLYESLKRNPYHPYNWPVYSAISLAYLAVLFPEFKESGEWLKIARSAMDKHLENDVYEDGGYLERSPGYSLSVYKLFYRYLCVFRYFSPDKEYYNKNRLLLEKMVQYFVYTSSPRGTICPFNDSHRNEIIDFIYSNGVDRPDLMGAIEPLLSEERKCTIGKMTKPEVTSINLEGSKYAVMRSDWSKDALMMIINYGPAANHNHEDVLDFELYAYGKPIALDAALGKYGYDDPLWIPWYRKAKSHNMLLINDSSIVRGESNVHDVRWSSQKHTDYFSGIHDGYKKYFGVNHKRSIAFIKSKYWVINDNILNSKEGLKTQFLFHSPLMLTKIENGYTSKEVPGYTLLIPEGEKADLNLAFGEADLTNLSEYNRVMDINYAVIEKTKENDNYTVLIYPYKETKPPIQLRKILKEEGISGSEVINDKDSDKIFFSDGKKHTLSDGIETDAEFIYVHIENKKIKIISVSASAYLKVNGKIILETKNKTDKEFEF